MAGNPWWKVAGLSILGGVALAAAPFPSGEPQQKPFRSATHFISTDVIVRDSQGRFISGLTEADFEVFEDGVRQKIADFALVAGGQAIREVAAPVPVRQEGRISLPPTRSAANDSGRVFIVFIDDLHLQASDSPKARHLLKQIRDRLLREGDLVGVVSSGYSSIEINLGYDPNKTRFTSGIDRVMGSGQSPWEIINAAQTREGPAGLRHNAYVAFGTAFSMLDQVKAITNRRKAFIYVSSGYDFNPFTNSRFKVIQDALDSGLRSETGSDGGLSKADINRHRNPLESNGQQFADADLNVALNELTRAARRANVTFYTMDPRGLVAGPEINAPITMDEWTRFIADSHSSLEVLAAETGGFCACSTNEFLSAIRRIDNEMSNYYVLGYVSSNSDAQKVHRRIQIRVPKHPGATLVYKEAYRIQR